MYRLSGANYQWCCCRCDLQIYLEPVAGTRYCHHYVVNNTEKFYSVFWLQNIDEFNINAKEDISETMFLTWQLFHWLYLILTDLYLQSQYWWHCYQFPHCVEMKKRVFDEIICYCRYHLSGKFQVTRMYLFLAINQSCANRYTYWRKTICSFPARCFVRGYR